MPSKNVIFILYILFFYLNSKYKCLYISSGLDAVNNFLYLSRISKYYNQSKKSTCSFHDGSDCYFTENNYIKDIKTTKYDKIINQEWIKLYSQNKNFDYIGILYQLSQQTADYIEMYSKENDKAQNPPENKLNIVMTFDDETTKPNMYLHELKAIFYNMELIANFGGRLKLSDKYQETSKIQKGSNYPSKLYGIIESELITITFQKRLFIFDYIYIRANTVEDKLNKINFYGYIGEQMVYALSFSDNDRKENTWLKILSHTSVPTDKLVVSGPYNIDNIGFTFYYETNVNFDDIFDMNLYQKSKRLIEDDDI
jgi:hypothetical protein